MLYSTCTFSPEENEGTIAWLLEQYPQFTVVDAIQLKAVLPEAVYQFADVSYKGFAAGRPEWITGGRPELKRCIRLWPHRIDGEGHFIALLKKEAYAAKEAENNYYSDAGNMSSGRKSSIRRKQTRADSAVTREAYEFLKAIRLSDGSGVLDHEDRLSIRDDRLHMVPEGLPDLKGLRILREGLLLGEQKKNRFEPSQALACALDIRGYLRGINLPSSSEDVIRYLKCETITPKDYKEDGWQLVCTDGYPLGWCKITKGSFKNKYLPGWRWM